MILAAVLAGVLAAPASAATVALDDVQYCTDLWGSCRYMQYSQGVVLTYAGEPGERNSVAVGRTGNGIDVADGGATLHARGRCAAASAGVAHCETSGRPLVGYRLDGGDQDDSIVVAGSLAPAFAIGVPHLLAGGPGDDVLVGGADPDVLAGGPGSDRLGGGAGDDVFFTAPRLGTTVPESPDGAEPDLADGGPGLDTADYSRRTRPLRLDLGGAAGGGEPGERDRLSNVEGIVGGSGSDVLVGASTADRLDGQGGDDRLDGRGGNDELVGAIGRDTLFGGDGDDRLGTGLDAQQPMPADADRAVCGGGRDVVGDPFDEDFTGEMWRRPDPLDVLARDCERVPFTLPSAGVAPVADPRPTRRGRRAWEFRNPCLVAGDPPRTYPCVGRIELALPEGKTLARGSFRRNSTVKIALGTVAGRRLGRARRVAVRIYARYSSRSGPRDELAFVLAAR